MKRTYTEAQYSTPAAMKMIREQFMDGRTDEESIEATARYMSKTLRIGGMRACRALVMGAVRKATDAEQAARSARIRERLTNLERERLTGKGE